MYQILYVDGEPARSDLAKSFLDKSGEFSVTTCHCATDGLSAMQQTGFDAVISQHQLPGMDGTEFLKAFRAGFGDIPFILVTGRGGEEEVIRAINNHAAIFIQREKDLAPQCGELIQTIKNVIDQQTIVLSDRENRELFRYIVRCDTSAIAVFDRNLSFMTVNDRYLSYYNVLERDIIGKSLYEVFPTTAQRWSKVLKKCLAGAVLHNDDGFFEMPDGSIVYNRWECRPWHTRDNGIGGVISFIEDTTQRKLAELELLRKNVELTAAYQLVSAKDEELKRNIEELTTRDKDLRISEERFRTLVDQSPFSIMIMSPDGKIVRVNKAFEQLWGITATDLADYSILKDEQLKKWGIMPLVIQAFAGRRISLPPIHYDGSESVNTAETKWVQSVLYPVTDESGTVQSVILMHENITRQKEAEEELKRNEKHFRQIIETADEGIWSLDAQFVTRFVNKKMAEILGYNTVEMTGKPLLNFVVLQEKDLNIEKLRNLKKGKNQVFEGMFRHKTGKMRWMRVSAIALTDNTGAFTGAFARVTDITDTKKK